MFEICHDINRREIAYYEAGLSNDRFREERTFITRLQKIRI